MFCERMQIKVKKEKENNMARGEGEGEEAKDYRLEAGGSER